MKFLRFTLSGKQAFFKKPEVNTFYYFTYGHIHRVALLGMFGAILGYDGYAQQTEKKNVPNFPEFYEKLKDIKTAIVPVCEKGSFPRKIVSFNNSVGYASKEQGGNLIVKQQWLEKPEWIVYVMLDCKEAERIAESMMQKRCVYTPYLGSNDHFADITEAEVVEAGLEENPGQIHSLFVKSQVEVDLEDDMQENPYRYEEALPSGLDAELNMYVYERYVLTNLAVKKLHCEVYNVKDSTGNTYDIVLQ